MLVLFAFAFKADWLVLEVDVSSGWMLFHSASRSFPATWLNNHWFISVSEVTMLVDAMAQIGLLLEWNECSRSHARNKSSNSALTASRVVFFEQKKVRCFSKLSSVGSSLNCLWTSSIQVPFALLPLNCFATLAWSLSYINFADSSALMTCWISADNVLKMTPAVMLSGAFHSFISSWYTFTYVISWQCYCSCCAGGSCRCGHSCWGCGSLDCDTRISGFRIECNIGILSIDDTLDILIPHVPVIVAEFNRWFPFYVIHGSYGGMTISWEMREIAICVNCFLCVLCALELSLQSAGLITYKRLSQTCTGITSVYNMYL